MPRRKSPADHLSVDDILRDANRNTGHDQSTGHNQSTGHDQNTGPNQDTDPEHDTGPARDCHVYQAVDAIIHSLCEGFGLPSSLEMALREVGTLAARRVLPPPSCSSSRPPRTHPRGSSPRRRSLEGRP